VFLDCAETMSHVQGFVTTEHQRCFLTRLFLGCFWTQVQTQTFDSDEEQLKFVAPQSTQMINDGGFCEPSLPVLLPDFVHR
jgi:hypothetical protein